MLKRFDKKIRVKLNERYIIYENYERTLRTGGGAGVELD